MSSKLIVSGAEITVTTIDDRDYISLTDMRKQRMETSLSRIGCGIETQLSFLVSGNRFTTQILIMANSP